VWVTALAQVAAVPAVAFALMSTAAQRIQITPPPALYATSIIMHLVFALRFNIM
jgi:hypothetical protein